MTGGQVAGLLGFSILLATGQTLFKTTALALPRGAALSQSFPVLLRLPSFWAALALYGLATLLWIHLLQSVPLSRAYPFAALGFVIVPASAALLFGEVLTPAYLVGTALIVAGVFVTARA